MLNTKINMLSVIIILTGIAFMPSASAEETFRSSVKNALEHWTATLDSSDLNDFSAAWNKAATQVLDVDEFSEQNKLPTIPNFQQLPDPLAPDKMRSLWKNETFMSMINDLEKDDHFVSNFHAISIGLVENNPTYKTFSFDKITQYWLGTVFITKQLRASASRPTPPCPYPWCGSELQLAPSRSVDVAR